MSLSSAPMPGCIFEFYGRIPASVYTPSNGFRSPLERAVFYNDLGMLNKLVQEGHKVNIELKVEQMTCLEYAAMKGYTDVMQALMAHSVCSNILKEYFAMEDVVERAYLISHNKRLFFDQRALAEANRYIAATYTAIVHNHPRCLEHLLTFVQRRDLGRHTFFFPDDVTKVKLTACELARALGHMECFKIITLWQHESTCELTLHDARTS